MLVRRPGDASIRTGAPNGVLNGRNVLIDESVVEGVIATALRTGGDFAEVFAEDRRGSLARLDDGRVEELTSGRERGAGIRVVAGETTGFAHTSDLSESGLRAAAEAAAAAARGGGGGLRIAPLSRLEAPMPNSVDVLPESVPKSDKVDLLRRADESARGAGAAIRQVSAVYGDSRRRILVANSEGVLASDDQVKTRFAVSCVASGDAGMQTGRESIGSTVGFELFKTVDVDELGRLAANRALTKLKARPAPSGSLPVVIKRGSGGVLFHEACGHGLEADHIAKEVSVFAGKVGERVASPLVTLVDDGTMGPEWGALAIDDEGHPAGRNVLIENGVLTDYMWDWLRSRKEGRRSSGNGRRESYQHLPMVRMTNTYVLAGEDDPDEIIRQTPHGVYVAQLGGGQVNTATGDFVFGMTEAYLIEDGEITEPLRDANLIGNGPEVLRNIDVVGNDFAMGPPGTCGKKGQGVPVGDGQPTLRVTALTIGGTAR
ncbi:MAG TPA: TldD/PmbA family protein [Acidimicrobiales bacterium]